MPPATSRVINPSVISASRRKRSVRRVGSLSDGLGASLFTAIAWTLAADETNAVEAVERSSTRGVAVLSLRAPMDGVGEAIAGRVAPMVAVWVGGGVVGDGVKVVGWRTLSDVTGVAVRGVADGTTRGVDVGLGGGKVILGVAEGCGVHVDLGVDVGRGVALGRSVCVALGVAEGKGVVSAVPVPVGVIVGEVEGVTVGNAVPVAVGRAVGVRVAVGVSVARRVGATAGVGLAAEVGVGVGVVVAATPGVAAMGPWNSAR